MLGTEKVHVGHDVVRDSNGNTTKATPDLGDVTGCLVRTLSASELIERGRSGSADVVQVLLPITEGIDKDTILTVRGDKKYRVDGNPLPYIDDEDPELSGYDLTASRKVG